MVHLFRFIYFLTKQVVENVLRFQYYKVIYQFLLTLFNIQDYLPQMKVKPYKEELIQLILRYLQKQLNQQQIASKLRKKHISHLPQWVLQNNLLINKGLTKIIKSYVQMDKNIKQYYISRKPQSEQQQNQMEQQQQKSTKKTTKKQRKKSTMSVQSDKKPISKSKQQKTKNQPSHHQNTSTWVKNKFEPPKKLEQIGKDYQSTKKPQNIKKPQMVPKEASSQQSSDRPLHSDHSSSSQQQNKIRKNKNEKQLHDKPKTNKNKKIQQKVSSSQSSEQSSQQKKPAIKQKKVVKLAKKQQKQQETQVNNIKPKKREQPQKHAQKTHIMHTRLDDIKENPEGAQKTWNNKSYSSFSRIKIDQVGPIPEKLRDNSFEAKFKYGKGDQWGKYGHEKLKDTRGESFKKTKDKLKNKAFQGANIDFNAINSIRLD